MGGVRRRDESPAQFRDRMAESGFSAAAQGPSRANNIAASRADGTFDAKRNAFNAANKGSFMDASGNIGPKAEMPTTPTMPTPTLAPSPAPAPAPAPNYKGPMARPPAPSKATFDGGKTLAQVKALSPTAMYEAAMRPPTMAPAKPPAPKASFTAAATSKPYAGPMARPAGSMASKPPAPPMAIAQPAAKPSMAQAASAKAPETRVASVPSANHSSPKPPAQPSIDELRQKAESAKAARQPGLTKVSKSFVGAAQAVDKAVPAAVSSVTSGIKNTGDSIVSAIDRGMAPARRWLYGSNQETPEEKAYKDAMAKQPQAQPDKQQPEPPKKKSPTFRKPYLANRPASLN